MLKKNSKEQRQKARVVCAAGNLIETLRLLLLSSSKLFPDGLANSSDQVGRNYMRHLTDTVYGAFKDKWGSAIPHMHYDDHDNDVDMRKHALHQGERVYRAAGAIKKFQTPPYPSTHNLETCRMSANTRNGVCNKWGQTHDINNLFISDGSQFASGGAENPTLTIVSLAIRRADYFARQMKGKAAQPATRHFLRDKHVLCIRQRRTDPVRGAHALHPHQQCADDYTA